MQNGYHQLILFALELKQWTAELHCLSCLGLSCDTLGEKLFITYTELFLIRIQENTDQK